MRISQNTAPSLASQPARSRAVTGIDWRAVVGVDARSLALCRILLAAAMLIDLWHVVKLGIPYEDVARIPSRYLLGIELNDGTLHCSWDLHEDTVNHRRFCGEGEFDVKGFVKCMLDAGYQGPWGIEVLSEELRTKPLEYAARHAYETTIAQFP